MTCGTNTGPNGFIHHKSVLGLRVFLYRTRQCCAKTHYACSRHANSQTNSSAGTHCLLADMQHHTSMATLFPVLELACVQPLSHGGSHGSVVLLCTVKMYRHLYICHVKDRVVSSEWHSCRLLQVLTLHTQLP